LFSITQLKEFTIQLNQSNCSEFVHGIEGAKRGQREGKERARRGLPILALSLPS